MGRRAAAGAAALCAVVLACVAAAPATAADLRLDSTQVSPRKAFFDAKTRVVELRYRVLAPAPERVRVRVVRTRDGKTVRHWVQTGVQAGRVQVRRWDGRRSDGSAVADGRYRFELGAPGGRMHRAGDFRFFDHRFPVAGPHRYGDRFGVPRSGGRTHEGQDVVADCGTPLVAARGGRVQARGYSDSLYGFWVLIDGSQTRRDYFYAHLRTATPLHGRERVRTGEGVGAVGKTGNARGEFCQLHFELWPDGYRHGAPKDPLGALRRWDRFS